MTSMMKKMRSSGKGFLLGHCTRFDTDFSRFVLSTTGTKNIYLFFFI